MRKVIPHNDTKNLTMKQHKRQSLKQKQKHQQDSGKEGRKVAIDIEFRLGLDSECRTLSSAR